MFKRSFAASKQDRAGKAIKLSKKSFRDDVAKQRLHEYVNKSNKSSPVMPTSPILTSAIITLVVGKDQRLFAAHEDVLCHSPFFAAACKGAFFESNAKRITLPDEQPEILSAVLEYVYKGDYYPRLLHDKKRNAWTLEDVDQPQNSGRGSVEATVYHSGWGDIILRDTAIYCAAEKYGLEELKRLSLRKQGLQSGIDVATILSSARFAYANTPDSDSRLRAHYLALIIRSRKTFKRSGTMQMEMEIGGKLFFDLFVAMCNHMDDVADLSAKGSPRTI